MEIVHITLPHLSMKSDMRTYNRELRAAVTKELLQLHTPEAFGPLRAEDMKEAQNKDAMEMLIFLKQESDGTIKAHGCKDRSKQREKYNNADATSPTVSIEAILIPAVIDA